MSAPPIYRNEISDAHAELLRELIRTGIVFLYSRHDLQAKEAHLRALEALVK